MPTTKKLDITTAIEEGLARNPEEVDPESPAFIHGLLKAIEDYAAGFQLEYASLNLLTLNGCICKGLGLPYGCPECGKEK